MIFELGAAAEVLLTGLRAHIRSTWQRFAGPTWATSRCSLGTPDTRLTSSDYSCKDWLDVVLQAQQSSRCGLYPRRMPPYLVSQLSGLHPTDSPRHLWLRRAFGHLATGATCALIRSKTGQVAIWLEVASWCLRGCIQICLARKMVTWTDTTSSVVVTAVIRTPTSMISS